MRELLEYKTSQDVSRTTLSRAIDPIALRNDSTLEMLKIVVVDVKLLQKTFPSFAPPSKLHDNIRPLSQVNRGETRRAVTSKVVCPESLAIPDALFRVRATIWVVFAEYVEPTDVDVCNGEFGLDGQCGREGIEVIEVSVYLI